MARVLVREGKYEVGDVCKEPRYTSFLIDKLGKVWTDTNGNKYQYAYLKYDALLASRTNRNSTSGYLR